jgi:predicted component of type VI protein secretion system
MRARVLFRDAQGRSGEVDLSSSEPCYIGRALDCAVRTDDAMVSRKHSLIRSEAGRFVIEDLGSSNGTHVNDRKVQRQALNHNDVVRCGNLWLRYVEEADRIEPAEPEGQVAVPDAVAATPSGPSKFRSTLGGGSQPPGRPRAAIPATVAPSSPPSPGAARPPAASPPPAPAAATPGPAAVSAFGSTQDGTGPGGRRVRSPIPPTLVAARLPGDTPTPAPAPIELGQGHRVPIRPQSPDATPIAMSHARATTEASADELTRKLRFAIDRAAEVERGLHTLQGELETAQGKIRKLLSAIQEITGIELE